MDTGTDAKAVSTDSKRTLRWFVIAAVVAFALLAAWIAAGPWLAIRGIEQAIEKRDTARLERHVDFPRVRTSLKAQVDDRIVRGAGSTVAGNMFGAAVLALAGSTTGKAVDALATPGGIAAFLQGHAAWQHATGNTRGRWIWTRALPARPLQGAALRYESFSRFSATLEHPDGGSTVFMLEREGLLRWRLVDIRLSEDLSAYFR